MANEEHLKILKQGVETWNAWREENPDTPPDLMGADLKFAELKWANLEYADLSSSTLYGATLMAAKLHRAVLQGTSLVSADLRNADLREAFLRHSTLRGANLREANLSRANLENADARAAVLYDTDLSEAVLRSTDFSDAQLTKANFSRVNVNGTRLTNANFDRVVFSETILSDVDLSRALGLSSCHHFGPSAIDYHTLAKSKSVPLAFWRGCGLPDTLIDYLPSLSGQAIQLYSCFISYSSKDQEFADRLHADLQDNGVRCWFAPHDMRTGDRIRDKIDEQIRVHDKLLLILSDNSVASNWVENEVEAALDKEKDRQTTLFPVRIDAAIDETDVAWAKTIKRTRHITDFSGWKDHDSYQKAFQRILRDLKPQQ